MEPGESGAIRSQVTVVVLTYNRRAEALNAVARALELPGSPEVIVVDNSSKDGTPEALRARYPGVAILQLPKNIGGAGRNVGLQAARTPYVAFCDDDVWWEPASIRNAIEVLAHEPSVAVIAAHVLVGESDRVDQFCDELARTPLGSRDDTSGYPVLGFMAGASIVRRSALLSVGGFAAQFLVGGEEELAALDLAATGWHIRYVPDVVVHHHPSPVRNPADRRRLILRNALWTALLRYPPRLLLSHGQALMAEARRHRLARRVLVETLRESPWLLSGRRRLPGSVVQQVALLRAASPGVKV